MEYTELWLAALRARTDLEKAAETLGPDADTRVFQVLDRLLGDLDLLVDLLAGRRA